MWRNRGACHGTRHLTEPRIEPHRPQDCGRSLRRNSGRRGLNPSARELQKNEVKRLKRLSRAQNCTPPGMARREPRFHTQGPHDHFNGSVYVATPQLLATYGIKASQISPGTDIVTMRRAWPASRASS